MRRPACQRGSRAAGAAGAVGAAGAAERRAAAVATVVAIIAVAVAVLAGCGGGDDGPPAAFCDAYAQVAGDVLANVDVHDPASLHAALDATVRAAQQLVDNAPEEIRSAAQGAKRLLDQLSAAISKYGYDLQRTLSEGTPEELALFSALSESAATGKPADENLAQLDAYGHEHCPDVSSTTASAT